MHAHDKPEQQDHEGGHAQRRLNMPTSLPAGLLSPGSVLALQRQVGNAAVARMLAERENPLGGQPLVQRSAVHEVLRSPGRPLDGAVQAEMETKLGADFSDVRVHTDAAARDSAKQLKARAFTSGTHVVIGEGGENPTTLAHELVHVIQQRQGPVAGADNGSGLSVSDPSDRFEREAERIATQVTSAPAPRHAAGSDATQVMRSPRSATEHSPIQRAVTWHKLAPRDPALMRFGAKLGDLTQEAADLITQNADTIPHPGGGYIELWYDAYRRFLNPNDGGTGLLHARFGYAVESLVQHWVGERNLQQYLPAGYRIDFQVNAGATRPDIVVSDGAGTAIGWFDITSSKSLGHIDRKVGSQWRTLPYVAEFTYRTLEPMNLRASDAGPLEAAKNRHRKIDADRKKKARVDAVEGLVHKVFTGMPEEIINNKDKKRAYFQSEMGVKVATAKLSADTARSLLTLLDGERRAGPGGLWMTAFGYVGVPWASGRDPKRADMFIDRLFAGSADASGPATGSATSRAA